MHHYTHITASPLYTNPTHTIERLSRSSWQITSPHLSAAILAKSYAEAKQLASEIDFNALSTKAAEPEPVDVAVIGSAAVEVAAVNPFEAILTEAATIRDLGTMQGAYDQAVRECDLCAVLGHLSERCDDYGRLRRQCFQATDNARAKVPDYARVVELAGLLTGVEPVLDRLGVDVHGLANGEDRLAWTVETMCDLPDTAGYIKRALILWACSVDLYGEPLWVARLRLEGAALRHAREVAGKGRDAQEVRKVEDGGLADMGGDRAREWGEVWDVAFDYDAGEMSGFTMAEAVEIRTRYIDRVEGMMPSLLSPEPEHWIPLQDGRVLIVNWRAGEVTGEVVSAAVWMDDGGLSLMGSYVLGSGWVSDDRLGEEDVDGEALGVILEAIARAGLAAVA